MMSNVRGAKLYTAEQIRNSPSRSDGVSEALEKEYRQKTCLFLKAAGKELELPIDAVATATVFFHKFFMLHSFKRHERLFIGSACLFVAAKVEESSKRVELVMSKCWKVWHGGRDPPAENEKAFKRLREKILIAERCVLHTLGFQLTVEHPYSAVMSLLKKLFAQGRGADGGKGADKALNRQLGQAATSFVNDSLLTTACIQYRPSQVAAAVVYLSYLYMGLPRIDTTLLDTDSTVVADICDAILSLYDDEDAGHSSAVIGGGGDIRDAIKQRTTKKVSAGTSSVDPAIGTPSPPLPTHSPRQTLSPRPTEPNSLKPRGSLPSSASSSSFSGTVVAVSSNSAAALNGKSDDALVRKRDVLPRTEWKMQVHQRHRGNSPPREEQRKSSGKRKSGESTTDLERLRKEDELRGGGTDGGGTVDAKRRKLSPS